MAVAGSVGHPSLGAQRENGDVRGDYSKTISAGSAAAGTGRPLAGMKRQRRVLSGTGEDSNRRKHARKRQFAPFRSATICPLDGLKSWVPQRACGFDSRPRHQSSANPGHVHDGGTTWRPSLGGPSWRAAAPTTRRRRRSCSAHIETDVDRGLPMFSAAGKIRFEEAARDIETDDVRNNEQGPWRRLPGRGGVREVHRHQNQGPVDFAEPVWRAFRHHDEITLADLTPGPAVNARPRQVLTDQASRNTICNTRRR